MRPAKFFLVGGWLAVAAAAHATDLTLSECLDMARAHNERLPLQKEILKRIEAQKNQTRASILPDVRWKQDTLWQDTSGVSSSGGSGSDSNAVLKRRRLSYFNATQPLFSGFKEFSTLSSLKSQHRAEASRLIREDVQLSQDVARAFYTAVSLNRDLLNIRTSIKLNEDRIRELKERVRLGRSREGELASAESQLADVKADEARTRGDLAVAREQLVFLIGAEVNERTLADDPALPVEADLATAQDHAASRSDLSAYKEILEARRFAVRAARADRWPVLEAEGNTYTHRIGLQKNIDWDVTLSIDVPVFKGGGVSAQIDQALSQWREARLLYDQARRQVRLETASAHAALMSSLEEARLLDDAYQKAKRNYELLSRDYRYGLVTNLDVLQGLTVMQQVKQAWDRAQIQTKIDAVDLAAATETNLTSASPSKGDRP